MRVDFCVLEITDPVKDLSIFPQHLFRESRSLLLSISKLMDSVFHPLVQPLLVSPPPLSQTQESQDDDKDRCDQQRWKEVPRPDRAQLE